MAVLVTGGAGYIGGHMVLGLLDAGEEPIVIDDMSNGVPRTIPQGVHFVQGDIGDYETVARTIEDHRIDAVIHLAALLIAPQFEDDPLEYYHANAVKTAHSYPPFGAAESGISYCRRQPPYTATPPLTRSRRQRPLSRSRSMAGPSSWPSGCCATSLRCAI